MSDRLVSQMQDDSERGGHGLTDEQQRDLRNALNPYSLAPAYSPYQTPMAASIAWDPVMDILRGADEPIMVDVTVLIEALITAADQATVVGTAMHDHSEMISHLVTAAALRAVAFGIVEGLT